MMRSVILYRNMNSSLEDKQERNAATNAGFVVLDSRMEIKSNDLVVCRYSSLPYYKELENDIKIIGAKLINSFRQHRYVADLQNWVADLQELTPDTWCKLEDLPNDGSFILKGETNSKKNSWSNMMYAANKAAACEVYSRLCEDGLIGFQDIYIRRYIPLKTYMIGLKDLPITQEFRFFVYKQKIISGGYYWSSHIDDIEPKPNIKDVPKEFLQDAINRIGDQVTFYSLDVAQTAEENKYIVIELNCGTMSGLSCNDPEVLYRNLFEAINAGT